MSGYIQLIKQLAAKQISAEDLRKRASEYSIYPASIHEVDGSTIFLYQGQRQKELIIINPSNNLSDFTGQEMLDGQVRICPANVTNLVALWRHFSFTRPVPYGDRPVTMGLGDRLGIATPGHIQAISKTDVFPILAQQSMRELKFTNRTYEDVLSAAAWSVFQEGYRDGYGADGDHLKTAAEIKMALETGMTMITLDCSDYIDNSIEGLGADELRSRYAQLPEELRAKMKSRYLDKTFRISETIDLTYNDKELMKLVLIYHKAIEHVISIYRNVISLSGDAVDFEISIDETQTSTSPQAHFFVASELKTAEVVFSSLAPRFCGEFQKGIDYIGDKVQFEQEFAWHVSIAQHFASYKISVHSGSDKFSIFPVIGEKTKYRFHIKTAGTSWLEAIRVIAKYSPGLYREIHMFALENLEEAKKHYAINTDPDEISDISAIADIHLPELMDNPDARQLIHISYGLILNAANPDGSTRFRDRLYEIWYKHELDYAEGLTWHIGRHLSDLGIRKT